MGILIFIIVLVCGAVGYLLISISKKNKASKTSKTLSPHEIDQRNRDRTMNEPTAEELQHNPLIINAVEFIKSIELTILIESRGVGSYISPTGNIKITAPGNWKIVSFKKYKELKPNNTIEDDWKILTSLDYQEKAINNNTDKGEILVISNDELLFAFINFEKLSTYNAEIKLEELRKKLIEKIRLMDLWPMKSKIEWYGQREGILIIAEEHRDIALRVYYIDIPVDEYNVIFTIYTLNEAHKFERIEELIKQMAASLERVDT